jgi:hypothetical protein
MDPTKKESAVKILELIANPVVAKLFVDVADPLVKACYAKMCAALVAVRDREAK